MTAKSMAAHRRGIPVVTVQWCEDSLQNKRILDNFDKYSLQLLQGLIAVLFGFQEMEIKQINEFIRQNGGSSSCDIQNAKEQILRKDQEFDFNLFIVK